jgi:hypothetical protein
LKNLDDLKRKNKPLFIVKTYDYFKTVFKFLFGSAVANASTAVSAAAVADGSCCYYWYSSSRNSALMRLEKLG